MGTLTLIMGGAKSGKSNYAQKLVQKLNKQTVFIATALAFDDDMRDRIRKHKESRPKNWNTIEIYKNFKSLSNNALFNNSKVILLDCLTLFVTNQMLEAGVDWENTTPGDVESIENGIKLELESLLDLAIDKDVYIVSNEVGMGVVPDNKLANYFRDILGRINQLVASKANQVIFMIAGIPLKIKGEEN